MEVFKLLLGTSVLLLITPACAKVGFFWHITDIHYDSFYTVGGDTRKYCSAADSGMMGSVRRAGKFGDYNCDSPWSLVESAAKAMKKHGDNIEFVLWTGDGVASSRNPATDHELSFFQNLTHLLRHTFSTQFVFPVLGHVDPGPGLGKLYKQVADLWRHWLPNEAIHTFNKGGYYTVEQKERKLRIVALNTNLLFDGTDAESNAQWQWLEAVLDKSRKKRETVYLVGHTPPGVDERQNGLYITIKANVKETANRRYLRIIRKFADVIVGQFFGHLHSDTFRVVLSDSGVPVSWMFIAPAITPRRSISGANNPGIRLYKFDTDTGQVFDYVQYYLDLSNANQRDRADWQQEYNLTSYYGLTEISPASLHSLAEGFITQSGSELFYKYFRANSVRFHQGPLSSVCDLSCAYTHYCAITRVDYDKFRACLETEPSAFASRGSQSFIFAETLFSFLVAGVFLANLYS